MILKPLEGTIASIQVLLIVLRLLNVIEWSWWLVFSPILVMAALGIVIFIIRRLLK